MSYKWAMLNEIILSAKIGDKNSFNQLWKGYSELFDNIFLAFCKIYKFLESERFETKYTTKMWFVELINKYSFDSNYGFGYYLKEGMIEKTRQHLRSRYMLPEEIIVKSDIIRSMIKRKEISQERRERKKRIRNSLCSITTRQLQVVFLYFYKGNTLSKCAEILGISDYTVSYDILRFAHTTLHRCLHGIKTEQKTKPRREKVYRVYRLPKRENRNVI